MHWRCLVPLTLFLLGAARRSTRIGDGHYDAQQQNKTFTETLDVLADARETFFPSRLWTDLSRPISLQQYNTTLPFGVGLTRATVDLRAATGPEEDPEPSDSSRRAWLGQLLRGDVDEDDAWDPIGALANKAGRGWGQIQKELAEEAKEEAKEKEREGRAREQKRKDREALRLSSQASPASDGVPQWMEERLKAMPKEKLEELAREQPELSKLLLDALPPTPPPPDFKTADEWSQSDLQNQPAWFRDALQASQQAEAAEKAAESAEKKAANKPRRAADPKMTVAEDPRYPTVNVAEAAKYFRTRAHKSH